MMRMPSGSTSGDNAAERHSGANLVPFYEPVAGNAREPPIEEMLTMKPLDRRSIARKRRPDDGGHADHHGGEHPPDLDMLAFLQHGDVADPGTGHGYT